MSLVPTRRGPLPRRRIYKVRERLVHAMRLQPLRLLLLLLRVAAAVAVVAVVVLPATALP